MSDRFGLKVKENAGKTKYSSLNLNQTYKGTKVETKTSSGTARHGLQSLGKATILQFSLVPSGGGGWGSAKEKPSETPPVVATPQTAPPSSTASQTNAPTSQQPLLQPQRPIGPPSHPQHVQQPQPQSQNSGQTQTQPAKQQQQESQGKTWGSVSSNEAGGQVYCSNEVVTSVTPVTD
ncbi:Proline-rich coiled-coil [Desmophyllum pertusum]|uniref:Proline-rich coiled-coil n=1 Tax=Desmophyllum pertusum TaxID=174260 RepID=A0A9W9YFN5_9CNID|nr:Proline-rich coiled-coil [Desmophyllum pertusum]